MKIATVNFSEVYDNNWNPEFYVNPQLEKFKKMVKDDYFGSIDYLIKKIETLGEENFRNVVKNSEIGKMIDVTYPEYSSAIKKSYWTDNRKPADRIKLILTLESIDNPYILKAKEYIEKSMKELYDNMTKLDSTIENNNDVDQNDFDR